MYQCNQQASQYYGFEQPDGHYYKCLNKTQGKKRHIINYKQKSSSQKSNENAQSKVKHISIRRLQKNQSHPNLKPNIICQQPLTLKAIDINDQSKQAHRSKKSPFKRILKSSRSCQTLYDPIERVAKVIKEEEKAKEERKLHEKALRQLVFVPTYTELNDTFLNLDKIIKEAKSSRVRYQLRLKENEKMSRLKLAKSIQVNLELPFYKQSRYKISTQRVKCYFSRKQESQINHNRVRDLFQSMGVCQSQRMNLMDQPRFPSLLSQNLQSSKTLTSNSIHNQFNYFKESQNNAQIQQSLYSQSSERSSYSSISSSSLIHGQSDYGFDIAEIGRGELLMDEKFSKVGKRQIDEQQQIRQYQSQGQSSIGLSSNQSVNLPAENVKQKSHSSSNSDYHKSSINNQLKMNCLQPSITSNSSIEIDSKIGKKHSILKKLQGNSEDSNKLMINVGNDSNLSINSKKQATDDKASDWRRKQTAVAAVETNIECGADLQHACIKKQSKQKAIRFIKVSKKYTNDSNKQESKKIGVNNEQV